MHMLLSRFFSGIQTVLCALFLCLAVPSWHMTAMAPGIPGLEHLSPEEMQQLEQELQAAAQQIDAYVSSLSPEEQAEFQRAVQEVEEMMSSMSEEELQNFFEQIISAEMEQAQMQQGMPPAQVQPQPVKLEHKPAPVISTVPLTPEEQKALTMLTSLIDATDKFLNKADNILDMENRFKNWAYSNKLSGISPSTTWQQEKDAINEFRVQMSDLKKTDLKTGKYLFIEAFIKNTALYNQVEQLSKQLETYEPRIIVSKIEKLSDDAKESLRSSLNAYGSTMQSAKADIKKLFDEIGPELAKIKEEEKKLTEKAQTEAAKGRQVTPGRTAGTADRSGYYGGGRGYDDYGYDGGYRGGRDYGDYGRPSQPGAEKAAKDKDKGRQPKAGGGKGKEEGKFEKDKDKKDKDKKDEKTDSGKADKVKDIVACPADGGEQLNGKLELIASNYRYIEQLLKENGQALNIDKLLTTEKVDPQLALYLFPTLERRLKRLNELVVAYKQQVAALKDETQKNAALEKLLALQQNQELLSTLAGNLEKYLATLKDTEKADAVIRQMAPDARYAYFQDKLKLQAIDEENPLPAPSEAIKKEMAESSLTSLSSIAQELQTLKASMPKPKKTEKKSESKPSKPKPAA